MAAMKSRSVAAIDDGLVSSGESAASIRRSTTDETSFFCPVGMVAERRVPVSDIAPAVAIRRGTVRVGGCSLEVRVADNELVWDVAPECTFGILPSSQGSFLSVVPGASFGGAAARTSCSWEAAIKRAKPVDRQIEELEN